HRGHAVCDRGAFRRRRCRRPPLHRPTPARPRPPALPGSLSQMMGSRKESGHAGHLVGPVLIVTLAGGVIISAALGVRQTFGLFVGPFAFEHGLPVTEIAFAIAL